MLAPIPRSKPCPMQSHALRPHVLSEHYAIANAAASAMNADATRTGNKADKADHSTLSARAGIICMTRQPALHKTMRATMRSRTSKNTCRSNNIKQAESSMSHVRNNTCAQYKQFHEANNTTTAQQQSWQGAGHIARAPAPMHNNGKANRFLINQPPQNTVALVNHFDGMHINVAVNANALVVLEASPRNTANERLRISRRRKATNSS